MADDDKTPEQRKLDAMLNRWPLVGLLAGLGVFLVIAGAPDIVALVLFTGAAAVALDL